MYLGLAVEMIQFNLESEKPGVHDTGIHLLKVGRRINTANDTFYRGIYSDFMELRPYN